MHVALAACEKYRILAAWDVAFGRAWWKGMTSVVPPAVQNQAGFSRRGSLFSSRHLFFCNRDIFERRRGIHRSQPKELHTDRAGQSCREAAGLAETGGRGGQERGRLESLPGSLDGPQERCAHRDQRSLAESGAERGQARSRAAGQ